MTQVKFSIPGISLIIFLITAQLSAQDSLSTEVILDKMTLANSYFMNKWPDPTVEIVTDKTRPSNIWTRATYYEGLMALYEIDSRDAYYNYAVQWGEGHNWEPAYGGTSTRNADNQCCGQTYIELYQIDPQPERIEKIKTTIDNMVNSTKNDDWWWIDALQMAMPIFAKLGVIYQDDKYFNKMYDLYNFTKIQHGTNGLYNTVDHLWWRDENFDPPYTAPNGEDTYWSRGNGWVLAALARVLDVMPKYAPHRDEYVTTFKEMAEALIAVQREDGFWNVSLHDPNDYGGKETSGTAFFTFGLAWGVNNSLLTAEQYKNAAVKAWNGIVTDALHPNGFLGYVQSTAKQPSDGQPVTYDKAPNFEDYGLGAFLLAGSEIYRLAGRITSVLVDKTIGMNVLPIVAELHPAFPNPFNPQTTINYTIHINGHVQLSVYDLRGNEINTLVNQSQNSGEYSVLFDASNLASGMYIYRLKVGSFEQSRRIILIQ
jgi:unsaturated rhamnogalacturonyl hydrolase